MKNGPPSNGSNGSGNILIEIIETLEAHRIDRDEYRLYDFIDVEALESLIADTSGRVEVQFTIQGICLAASKEGVTVLEDERDR